MLLKNLPVYLTFAFVINWSDTERSINSDKYFKLASFLTCFCVHSSELCIRGAAFLCIRHRELLCDGGKLARSFAIEFLRIQNVNYGKGNLMRGRHRHSTFLRVQHPFPRKYRKTNKKKEQELACVITRVPWNDPWFTSCLQASLGRISGVDPSEFGLHGSCLSLK